MQKSSHLKFSATGSDVFFVRASRNPMFILLPMTVTEIQFVPDLTPTLLLPPGESCQQHQTFTANFHISKVSRLCSLASQDKKCRRNMSMLSLTLMWNLNGVQNLYTGFLTLFTGSHWSMTWETWKRRSTTNLYSAFYYKTTHCFVVTDPPSQNSDFSRANINTNKMIHHIKVWKQHIKYIYTCICAYCLLTHHYTPLSRAWVCLLYFAFSCHGKFLSLVKNSCNNFIFQSKAAFNPLFLVI